MQADTDVYLYGMTVWSTVHLLKGEYPEADTYGEITQTHQFPGGETGNSALVLARWGYSTRIDGPFLGTRTQAPILSFYRPYGIDCEDLSYSPDEPGVEDLVLVGGETRTVFGRFAAYFSGERRWSVPKEESIARARMGSVDPFFKQESLTVVEMALRNGVPYVTIDCLPDSPLHVHACATVVSGEFLRSQFGDAPREDLLTEYAAKSRGLVIFTSGSKPIAFKREDSPIGWVDSFPVAVKSTLGAGDTFRAGVIHGLLKQMDDRDIVRFAAATSACVCRRFPMAFDPPGLPEIQDLIKLSHTV